MNWFWDNLLLKKEDRFGMLIFLGLLILLLLGKWYLVVWYNPGNIDLDHLDIESIEYVQIPKEENVVQSLTAPPLVKPRKKQNKRVYNQTSQKEIKTKKAELFEFDPNMLSKDSLELLGIGSYAASNIVKYREKGGKFDAINDLKRIYGMDSSTFDRLKPYVVLATKRDILSPKKKDESKWKSPKPTLALKSIDINSADTTAFKSLRGIGPVYANRIVKFRRSLGGYFTLDQIKDVWGISDSLYLSIKPYLTVNIEGVEKKNINSMSKDELVKHPYIDWKKAKTITKYRKMHGDFGSIDDIRRLHGLENNFIDTLKQYFVTR